MKKIILLLFVFSFCCLKAQDTTRYIVLDVLEKQLDIINENEQVLSEFIPSFTEKDSLMVIKFQKSHEKELKILNNSESQVERDKALLRLQNEQQRIMKFEESVTQADSVLRLESRNWVNDYIQKEIRFYSYSKNIKLLILKEQPLYLDKNAQNLTFELTNFINESAWKEAYEYQIKVIKNKVLFDFNLD